MGAGHRLDRYAGHRSPTGRAGSAGTGPREDIVDPERARDLAGQTGALCVAWEGADVARAAAFSRRAFIELRVITDSCDEGAAANYHESMETVMQNVAAVLAAWLGDPETEQVPS